MIQDSDIAFWTSAMLRITDFRHGLLMKRRFSEVFENGVWLFVQGRRVHIHIEEDIYKVQSNALFHIAGDQKITIEAQSESEYFIAEYQAQLPPDISREETVFLLENSPMKRTVSFRLRNSAFVVKQFTQMADAWNKETMIAKLQIKQLLYSVIHTAFQEDLLEQASSVSIDVFEQAKRYLKEHFAQSNLVQQLADSLGVTRASLYEQFRRKLGLSPKQFVMQLRLDAACQALSKSNLSMDEIAAGCGLRDKSYFSRVFKQKYGMSPGMYRKENTSGKDERQGQVRRQVFPVSDQRDYLLIENFGRLHRYYGIPRRVVCLDYSAAEFCAALGIGDRLVGVASAESSLGDCQENYREILSRVPFIHGRSLALNVPDFEAIIHFQPDLVIGSSYSFSGQGGVEDASVFERFGIHIYALQATYMLKSTFEDVYADIRNLGQIFGREQRAEELIAQLQTEEQQFPDFLQQEPTRIFCFDSIFQDKAFTCGQSLESYMIRRAGGKNIFEDRPHQFVPVDWLEVAKANPQGILVHRFQDRHDSEVKMEFLKRISEIADTDAIRNHRFFTVGIKSIFPSMGVMATTSELSQWIRKIRG